MSSPSTIDVDPGPKKRLYEQTFRTPEYFCYNPDGCQLAGWRLTDNRYVEAEPNEQGWLWSKGMGLWLGTWQGEIQRTTATWLRFYTADGLLVPTLAEAEAQRADAAEAEVACLRALLASHSVPSDDDLAS